jgi:thiamine-monophosphate kinase
MRNETEIIDLVTKRLGGQRGGLPEGVRLDWLRLGLGDDAAVINTGGRRRSTGSPTDDLVLSCDQFLEGVHFLPSLHQPDAIGYKALARATSDLAAMGARPRFFLVTLALQPSRTGEWLEQFAGGIRRAAREFGMTLIGGDTSASPKIAISITVGGVTRLDHALTRSGARAGDSVFVSGTLGGAQLGLACLTARPKLTRNQIPKESLERHLRPRIRLALGQWLAGSGEVRTKIASAAIDISDGLSTDLHHICHSSRVDARIFAPQIPTVNIPPAIRRLPRMRRINPFELALHGGEDYELLFTVPRRLAARIPSHYKGVKLSRIGEIVARPRQKKSARVELVDSAGRAIPLKPQGWDSFRRDR